MDEPGASERPYRSHLQPACFPCRQRKSRCQTEADAGTCLLCKIHKTECHFPEPPPPPSRASPRRSNRRSRTGRAPVAAARATALSRRRLHDSADVSEGAVPPPLLTDRPVQQQQQQQQQHRSSQDVDALLRLSSAENENLNAHIVGPAVTNDSQVLADYLSAIPGVTRSTRMVIPESAGRAKPVLFTMVQKRPLGMPVHKSPAAEKLDIIEKLLEPHVTEIVNEINPCMPLLDESSFQQQFRNDKAKISPALLSCLYAHMIIYCRNSPPLSRRVNVDGRFIWNLANEAVYSELHLSPGVSMIAAILLNVGGRPPTSLIGNGVLLSSAVSMAHSLGLNYNPLHWNIPTSEKHLRTKIWWALLIHDKWTSLAHGTPPRISRSQQDVPAPTLQSLCEPNATEKQLQTWSIFIALVGLTSVLDRYLQQIYNIGDEKDSSIAHLELALHSWVDSLLGCSRHIVIRGTHLEIPGASNLRLAYLSVKLLLQRITLEAVKQKPESSGDQVASCYLQARETAEEIVIFTQDLRPAQLQDFWLSVSAFSYPATVNFLLRHALETETSLSSLAQSRSFRMARDLVSTLRLHEETIGWDIGNVCLAQHAEIVDKVLANVTSQNNDPDNVFDAQGFVMPDPSVLDQLFPNLWDQLQNIW